MCSPLSKNTHITKLYKILFLLFLFLFVAEKPFTQENNLKTTIVKINNAQRTEYRKDKNTDNEIIEMTGSVSITIEKDGTTVQITAECVNYDRSANMLFAQGAVHLVQLDGTTESQNIHAETLLFNTSTLEGIFDNSKIIQTKSNNLNLPTDSTLSISSELFAKSSSNAIAFKNAKLSFCSDPDPHWSIKASRIWMLPGGEFAFLNAVLYVGRVPLLYLPAFYYPKDELVFNPVFGYDNRKGYYFQTTTYLIGRKPLSSYTAKSNSETDSASDGLGEDLYNFMRPSVLKEQRREGLVLHNLDSNFTGKTDDYLKLMADYYGNFGGFLGLDGAYVTNENISVDGVVELGFSSTVMYKNGKFTQYASDDLVYDDSSSFLGMSLPFRYRTDLNFSVKKPFNFKLSMPIHSDPYFVNDFSDRKEFMDWVGFLTSPVEVTSAQKNTDLSSLKVTTFSWDAGFSYSTNFSNNLYPYISTVAIHNLSSSILFNSKERSDSEFIKKPYDVTMYSPERMFFYPSQVTPINISAEISGTIFEYPATKKENNTNATNENISIAGLEQPADFNKNTKSKKEDNVENSVDSKDGVFSSEDLTSGLELPILSVVQAPSIVQTDGIKYRLNYSITPKYVSQITYDSAEYKNSDDFKWDNMYSSYYQFATPVLLNSNLTYRQNFISLQNKLIFDPYFQNHPNLDGYKTKSSKDSVVLADFNARKLDLTGENRFSFRPFIYDPVFKNTRIDWNSTVRFVRTKFIGDVNNPEWDYLTADITDNKSLTENTLTAVISATETEKTSQTVTMSAALPPQTEEYRESINLTFPYVSLNFATGIKRIENTEQWQEHPLQQSATLNLPYDINISESFNYNLEENHEDSLKISLSHKGFEVGYTMQYTYGYDFSKENGWTVNNSKDFLPYNLSFTYVTQNKVFRFWKNRITWAPSLSTSLVYDFIKPVNSFFVFIPAITFRINNFLDLTFSSESRNSVVFRYVQDYTDYGNVLGGEENVLVDLFNSFGFWDTSLETRKNSGFKLKNLKITVKHNLCDWDFASSFTFQPKLVSDGNVRPYYSYDPYFTFAVTWRPMSGIKTQIVDNYGELELNP